MRPWAGYWPSGIIRRPVKDIKNCFDMEAWLMYLFDNKDNKGKYKTHDEIDLYTALNKSSDSSEAKNNSETQY